GVGRGFLSEDGLWIPTYYGIYRFDAVNGKVTADYPRLGRDEDHPVNIVWGDGVLVSAGREFLCARYAEGDVIRLAKERILDHPDAIGPILGAADIYLATGRLNLAIEHYRNARIRAEAHGVPAAERRAREGLHRALLRRAEEAMENEPERAPAKFEAAFTAAPSSLARLRARLRLDAILAARSGAEINEWRLKNLRELEREYGDQTLEEGGRTVRGWALRQMAGILVERRQIKRALAVLHRLIEADPESADGRRASGEIGAILENEGRSHYQPYGKRARKVFESAVRTGDLEALERGLAIYANAEAARDATLELARRRLKRGEAEAAAASLRRFLLERPGAPQVPEALMLMVRALDVRRSHGQAYSALQRLRRRHGDALVTRADGARVPARELVEEWLGRDPYPSVAKSARRRDLQAGLVERFHRSFEGEFVDVPDLQGQLPPALKEAVLLKAGSSLVAIDSRTGRLLYRIEFEDYEPLSPVVLVGDRLLALNERHVYVCDAKSGRTLARHAPPDGAKGLMLLEHQGQVFLLYQRSGLRPQVGVAALHPEDGSALWSITVPTEAAQERVRPGYVVAHADQLMLFSTHPVRMTVVNTTSGAIENRVLVEEGPGARLAVRPLVLGDGRVLVGLLRTEKTESTAWELSYSLHLLDPSRPAERAALWPAFRPPRDRENRYLHLMNVVGDHIVALDDAGGAAVLELHTGKRVQWAPRLPIGDAGDDILLTANQARHDSLLLVTTRARRGVAARLSAFEIPDLRRKYSVEVSPLREGAEVIDSQGALGIIIMPRQERQRSRIRLYDPLTGSQLQEILPGNRDVDWFTARVQNGILIVSPSGHSAYGYGPK
ncbi:MAG: tetratricopeptide repeat protein, partial [Planctomycetota bacterium]